MNAHVFVDYTVQDKSDTTKEQPADSKSKKPQPDTPKDRVSNVLVKDLTIAVGDVQKIELSDEMSRFSIDGPVKEAGIEVAFDAAPGALIAQLTSVDQTGDYAFEVPIKDPSAIGEWPQGVYPWTLENGVASALHLKNFTDKAQFAQMEIRFDSGTYNPKPFVLAPHQTMAIDIRKLKDSKTPDERGQVIPANVTHGQLSWAPGNLKTMIGRNEEVNVSQGIAKSFSCGSPCCGTRNIKTQIYPGSATMTVFDDQHPFVSQRQDYTCTNGGFTCVGGNCSPNFYWTGNWYNTDGYWSSDSTVATIVPNGYDGQSPEITTDGNPGTANITADIPWSQDIDVYDSTIGGYYCDVQNGPDQFPTALLTASAPTKFTLQSATDNGNGTLSEHFTWQSSDGNLNDIANCSVQENVTYPGGNPFVYPSPPFPVASAPNPTNTPNPPAPGSAGSTGINDTHYIPGGGGASSFVKPYSGYQVTATQYEQYKCGNQTTWTNFYGPAYIYRTIGQNSNGSWYYTVSRSDTSVTASINPLP